MAQVKARRFGTKLNAKQKKAYTSAIKAMMKTIPASQRMGMTRKKHKQAMATTRLVNR